MTDMNDTLFVKYLWYEKVATGRLDRVHPLRENASRCSRERERE